MKGKEIKPEPSAKDLIEDAAQTPPNLTVSKNAGIGNAMKKEAAIVSKEVDSKPKKLTKAELVMKEVEAIVSREVEPKKLPKGISESLEPIPPYQVAVNYAMQQVAAIGSKEVEPKKLPEKRSHSSQAPKVGKDLADSKNAGIGNALKKEAAVVSKEVEPKKLPKGISESLEPIPPYQAAVNYAMQQVAAIGSKRVWKPPSNPSISVAERVMKELEAVMVGDTKKARKPPSDSEDEDIDDSDEGEINEIAYLKEARLFAEVDRKLEKLFAEVALAERALPEPTDSKNCCRERKLERAVLAQDMSRIFEKMHDKKNKADETKKEALGKKPTGLKK